MPRYPVERSTNFIIEDESWTVVEYDHTSVPGIIYLSLTENKVNTIYDDLVEDIADTDKLAQYSLSVPAENEIFSVGDIVTPTCTLTKNGIPINLELDFLPTDTTIVKNINGVLTAVGIGTTNIIARVRDFPQITQELQIKISDTANAFSAYIEGAGIIRLDRDAVYELRGTSEINDPVSYSIDTNLATIVNIENNKCTIHANDKNLLGEFILMANYNGVSYNKTIKVIPLW